MPTLNDFELIDGRLVPKRKPGITPDDPHGSGPLITPDDPHGTGPGTGMDQGPSFMGPEQQQPDWSKIGETAKNILEPPSPPVRLEGDPSMKGSGTPFASKGDQPFEAQAKLPSTIEANRLKDITTARDDAVSSARRRESIGSGLDLLGRSIAGVTGKVDTTKIQGADLSGLKKATAEAEDKPTGEMIDLFKQLGIKLTPGMSMIEMDKYFPNIIGLKKATAAGEAKAAAASTLAGAKVTAADTAREAGAARFKTSEENKDRRAGMAQETATAKETANEGRATNRDFAQRPDVQAARKQRNSLEDVKAAMDHPNPETEQAVINFLPRMMGEVGNLSKSDRAVATRRMGWLNQLEDWYHQGTHSEFPPVKRQQIKELVDYMKEAQEKVLGSAAREHGQTYSKIYPGRSGQDIEKMVNPGHAQAPTGPQAGSGPMRFKLGNDTLDIPADKVDRFVAENPGAQRLP